MSYSSPNLTDRKLLKSLNKTLSAYKSIISLAEILAKILAVNAVLSKQICDYKSIVSIVI